MIRCTKLEPCTELGHAEAAGEVKWPGVRRAAAARKSLLISNHSQTQVRPETPVAELRCDYDDDLIKPACLPQPTGPFSVPCPREKIPARQTLFKRAMQCIQSGPLFLFNS